MTKSQRAAIINIIRFYRERNSYNGVTSVRIDIDESDGITSMRVDTRRSDCGKYSPRAIFMQQSAMFFIGKRGGIEVVRAEQGLDSETDHVSYMVHGKKWKK